MSYSFTEFDTRTKEIVEWLEKELSTVRTGRATPALLESVQVSSYGAKVPLNQVGNIGVEDARTLRISVWDAGQIKEVEKAVTEANLGLSAMIDEKGLRVVFPELTGERRVELLKIAKTKLEDARVSIRGARDEAIKKMEADELSKDDMFRAKEDLQKRVDEKNKTLETLFEQKEVEIQQ